MSVNLTRINNNQITDAVNGNVDLGINANAKIQANSITANLLAPNLVYNSNLTVTGNINANIVSANTVQTTTFIAATIGNSTSTLYGCGSHIANINAANIVGTYGNSNVANYLANGVLLFVLGFDTSTMILLKPVICSDSTSSVNWL